MLVTCEKCNKEHVVTRQHYRRNIETKSKFYCSYNCRYGNIEERFWSKVDKTDSIEDCWNWKAGFRNKEGYGAFVYNKKLELSHRVSWMMANGNIDNKLLVCHKCDNPKCVNPNHLFLGTYSENMKDCVSKNRLNSNRNKDGTFKSTTAII